MNIAHVVTYISPDGAFGGPVRVARGQAEALAARGHNVTIYAAGPGAAPAITSEDGYTVKSFPARRVHPRLGFAGMFAPGLVRSLREDLPSADAVHVHVARDLVTLPAARAARKAGKRVILQPHGMIDASAHPLAKPIDIWEVRPSLSSAHVVLALTEQEREDLSEISPQATIAPVRNGMKVQPLPGYDRRPRRVLFLARLHERKRPVAFVRAAIELVRRGVHAEFTLVGPDEGEGAAVTEAISRAGMDEHISWAGPIDPSRTDALMRQTSVFVLPSVGEIFPMTILEAFAAGTPVVTTASLGIAAECERYGAAVVTDGSIGQLADAIEDILLTPETATSLREGAHTYLTTELSIDAVVDQLLDQYSAPHHSRKSR